MTKQFYNSAKVIKKKPNLAEMKNINMIMKRTRAMEKRARRAEIHQHYDEGNFEADDIYLDIINKKLAII